MSSAGGKRVNKLPRPIADAGRQIQKDKQVREAGGDAPDPLARWRETQESLLKNLKQSADENDASRAKSYAIAAGIATEKVLLLENKPTAIIGGLQENRHMLPEILEKLAAAAKIVGRPNG